MKYHRVINSSSGITRAAIDPESSTLYLQFPNASYSYTRPDAELVFASLVNVKPHAKSLTEEDRAELQRTLEWTIGSEGSYLLRVAVGTRKSPFPNTKLDPDTAKAIWREMDENEAMEAARDEEAAH